MTPKEIDRLAGRSVFLPTLPRECISRSQETQDDFGIDYELELAKAGDQVSGFIFKVQQKGVETAKLSADGRFYSFHNLPLKKMTYYLLEMRIPVIFVVADLATKAVWWMQLQGNPDVEKAYREALGENQGSMTVRLPTRNSLPATFGEMVQAAANSYDAIVLSMLKESNNVQMLNAAIATSSIEESAKAIATQHDVFRSELIERMIQENKAALAFGTAEKIFKSEAESVPMRFSSALNLLRLFPFTVPADQRPLMMEQMQAHRLGTVKELHFITLQPGAQRNLRVYARFLHRAARLRILVDRDMGLHMTLRVQKESANAFTLPITKAAQMSVATNVIRELNNVQRSFFKLIDSKALYFVPHAWQQMATDLGPFLLRLKEDGLTDARDQIVNWLDATFEFAVNIANVAKDFSVLAMCGIAHFQVSVAFRDEAPSYENRKAAARAAIETIAEETIRNTWLSRFDKMVTQSETDRGGSPSFEDEETIYRQMAAGLGIDLEDPNDRIAEVVRIGLKDRNPERVLKNCQHMRVKLGACGLPGRMLGLPTAGSKSVICVKHNFAVEALKLDDAYETLKEEKCDKCPDALQHPADWKWSTDWQIKNKLQDVDQEEGL